MPIPRHRPIARAIFVGIIWCLLTVALGAVVIYSNPAFEGIVTPHASTLLMLAGAFLLAGILGTIIRSPILLLVLTALMCIGGASFFAIVVLAPTWNGVVERTVNLENYVTLRVFVYTAIMLLPALFGALSGIVVGGWMDHRGYRN